MGEVANQHFQDQSMKNNIYDPSNPKFGSWVVMSGKGFDDENDNISMDSSYEDSSTNSGSSSSSDLFEDASSSSSTSSSTSYSSLSSSMSDSKGPLYELSDLMLQLPIKRGLSKFYQGKSQSYTSLAHVKSIDDLAKKGGVSYSKRMKSNKSYANGLDGHKLHSPKATISKKTPRVSFSSLHGSRCALVTNCKPPISSQKC